MSTKTQTVQTRGSRDGVADPVLQALQQAEDAYAEARTEYNTISAALTQAQEALKSEKAEARKQVQELTKRLEAEEKRVVRYQGQARRMSDCMRELHGAIFGGNIYDLILNACITVTGATRGI